MSEKETSLPHIGRVGSVPASMYRGKCEEVDQLREALDMYRHGYQGACVACEPVALENQRLRDEVSRLKYALRRARDPNGPKWRREVIDSALAETGLQTADKPDTGFPGPDHQTEGWKR